MDTIPNESVTSIIMSVESDLDPSKAPCEDLKTELDLYANMVVLGRNCFAFEWSGKSCNVQPFDKNLGVAKDVPIIDAAIAYDCPYRFETYILLIRNGLYIPNLEDNLIPPFIMQQGGVDVNDVPKIHCQDPSPSDHCIRFKNHELKIPLKLNGTFSFFHTRTPTDDELKSCDKIFITPDSSHWNPYCSSFEKNEESMLNHEGDISDISRRENHIMEIDENEGYVASISSIEVDSKIDKVTDESFYSSYFSDSFANVSAVSPIDI